MSLSSVAEDIRILLGTAGKGTAGTDLFSFQHGSGAAGAEQDKQIVVTDTGNIDVILSRDYENPTFQITVRGGRNESVKTVYDRARDIYEFMISQDRQTINTNEYAIFEPLGGLVPAGKDKNNRHVYTMNFYTLRASIGA